MYFLWNELRILLKLAYLGNMCPLFVDIQFTFMFTLRLILDLQQLVKDYHNMHYFLHIVQPSHGSL